MKCRDCTADARGPKTGLCLLCYNREYQRRFRQTPAGKSYGRLYQVSESGKESQRRYRKSDKGQRYRVSPRQRFHVARAQAKHRGKEFTLTLENYTVLMQSICFYCDGPLSPKGMSLDRIDNAKGYTLGNVLPCCGRCNFIRSDDLTVEQTLVAVKAIKDLEKGIVPQCVSEKLTKVK